MTRPWEQRLSERAPTSAKIAQDARRVLAGGGTHELRFVDPFPIAVSRAAASRKWDVDGNEYVDYVVGHGALLLGHGRAEVVDAVREQLGRGTHFGAAHEAEVEWGALVCDLVPSAERVRFVSSGTEAVLLAARVARAFTGRSVIVKMPQHFHGWSDVGMVALNDPNEAGYGDVEPHRIDTIADRLSRGDVAAVIVEPSGGRFGAFPLGGTDLWLLRESSARHGALLIFDEVVTGFRWAVGGAQERFGITPDLTTLAKVLGGGLPGGALAGRADVMELFDRDHQPRIYHPGTFNANPLSAAAGIATLRLVANGEPTAKAQLHAAVLREALRGELARAGAAGEVYGEASAFHIALGDRRAVRAGAGSALRSAMLSHGIDLLGPGGLTSDVHGDEDIDRATTAFGLSLRDLQSAGLL
jgi:glutamate-1-semialdehyde 2,1-aminomutase